MSEITTAAVGTEPAVPQSGAHGGVEDRWWTDPWLVGYASVAVTVTALLVCIDQLTRPHALLGLNEYDDGLYLGAAERLVHGAVPYRSFVFPHPPGIVLLLLPLTIVAGFAGTRAMLAGGRILTAVVAAGNVFLLARIVRHRGLPAVLAAGGVLAVFPMAVVADKTVLLEPYLVLFCLLGTALMFSGDEPAGHTRLLLGGAAFGFAGAIKVWAILPAVVALAVCLPDVRRKVGPLVLGMAAGFALPSLPFFLIAPGSFVREVVTVQLQQHSAEHWPVGQRLVMVTGIRGLPSVQPTVQLAEMVATGYVAIVAAAFLVRPRPTRLDWFALGSASLTVAAILFSSTFHPHYAYFTAAFLALLIAVSYDRLVRAAGRLGWPRLVPALALVPLVAVTVFGFVEVRHFIRHEPYTVTVGDPGPATARVIPKGACVVTDEPTRTLEANRFVSDRGGCPSVVDSYYTWVVADPSKAPGSPGSFDPRLVRDWQSWFAAADYVVLSPSPGRIPWTPELTAWFHHNFTLVSSEGSSVYRRVGG